MQKISEVARVELLAPAGKWDVLEAVIGAGADDVYLGGKKFNMRLHRKDSTLLKMSLSQLQNMPMKEEPKSM